jgi:hypothetical protein
MQTVTVDSGSRLKIGDKISIGDDYQGEIKKIYKGLDGDVLTIKELINNKLST